MRLLCVEELGGKSGGGYVHQVLLELHAIVAVVHRSALESGARDGHGLSPASHDGHWMHSLVHKELRLTQQLTAQYRHGGGSVAHCVILHLGDVHKHLGGGVLHRDSLKDGCAIVRDGDAHVVRVAHALKDLVHACAHESGAAGRRGEVGVSAE